MMCGIVGCIKNNGVKNFLLEGLKELEYRGYDSAGLAITKDDSVYAFKSVGKLHNLINTTNDFSDNGALLGIAHTRWATHGKPTQLNAHPQSTTNAHVVHNGIIENYTKLKQDLDVNFLSQTDTEVIVHLFEKNYAKHKNAHKAFEETILLLEGSFAILLLTDIQKDTIFFAKKNSPLELAQKDGEIFFASSDAPLIGIVNEAYYLDDGIYGWARANEIAFFKNKKEVSQTTKTISQSHLSAQKEGYSFFTEKEIYEQKKVLIDVASGRLNDDTIDFEELDDEFLHGIKSINLCACGTSFHAGLVAQYLFGKIAKMRLNVEVASEFRYKEPVLANDELFVVISQSGETADTLEALKIAKKAGLKTLAICNVDNSSIVRLADKTILTRAGIEKGVASTKAFSAQTMVLWMLAVFFAQKKNFTDLGEEIQAIKQAHIAIDVKEDLRSKIHRLSKRYLHGHGFFFIGRDIFYPLALEGALKLKEISYLHAEGYPAGEMKHGPIALVDSNLFTIALLPSKHLSQKMRSNIEELSARDSTICVISPTALDIADDFIPIEEFSHPMCEFFASLVALQLLAVEISLRLGNDIDMPRNLAKSVTVE